MDTFREPLPARRRWERLLPWFAALLLAAGVIAAIVRFVPSTSGTTDSSRTENPTKVSAAPSKTVPLAPEARRVAGRFILTAVARKNLAEGWKLSGPQIRQGMSHKEWMTGNIPVVPYLTPISVTPMKIDYSLKNEALVEVALVPEKGHKGSTDLFWLELKRVGKGSKAHWLVWSWVPRFAPAIPANPVG